MLGLKNFEERELALLRTNLEALLDDQVITGVNGYSEIFDFDACLPLSYLHHSENHKKKLSEKLVKHKRLKQLTETWKARNKKAIYWWDPDWPIKDEEKEQGIEFYILRTWQKFSDEQIKAAKTISKFYHGNELIVAQDNGYDLNFRIDSRIALLGLINIFRKHVTPFLTEKTGKPIYDENGQRKENKEAIVEPYWVPVIVYKDRFGLFKGEVPGFKEVLKLAIIRGNEEISTYIDQKYPDLGAHKTFKEIQQVFAGEYSETKVYANLLFVNHINGIRMP